MAGFNELLGGVTSIGNVTSTRTQEIRGPLDGVGGVGGAAAGGSADSSGGKGVTFADLLQEKLAESNTLIQAADASAEELIAGRHKDIHGAMIALEKADVSFRMLMGVRNKMLEAYREIMRMQV